MKQQNTWTAIFLQAVMFLSEGYLSGTQVVAQASEVNQSLDELRRIEAAIMKTLHRSEQATVSLEAGGRSGSAVIVSKDGLILTAAHVVDGQKTMTVRFADNRTVKCKVLGSYGPADAAMAQIIEPGEYPFAEVAPQGSVKQGDTIYALGNPSGFDLQRGMPIRAGHVTGISGDFVGIDAVLIRGDSGGPSFNLNGEVVGIHSNISESVSVNNDSHIDAFHRNWQSMLAGEKTGRVFGSENASDELIVGLKLFSGGPGEPIVIDQVIAETPADWAQLETGDAIIRVNGSDLEDAADFLRRAKQGEWGRTLQLDVLRSQETMQITLELMTFSEMQADRDSRQPANARELGKPKSKKTDNLFSDPQQRRGKEDKAGERKSELQRLMERARKNGGRMEIDRSRLLDLNARLGKRMNKLSTAGGRMKDAWSMRFSEAFSDYASRYSRAIYPVLVTGKITTLAVVVSEDGHLVTKASEIDGRKFQVVLRDDLKVEAESIAINRDDDLALIKINPSKAELFPVDFVTQASPASPKGTLVCCVNNTPDTLAGFGVVSVGVRALNGSSGAILGVEVRANEEGLEVTQLSPASPAAAAGIQNGDIITEFDGECLSSAEALASAVAAHMPDEQICLNVVRGNVELSITVTLGNRSKLAPMAGNREQDFDKLSASLSRRRWSFTMGIQHDCAIRPKDCGGLLLDLEGRIVGLNIARAGRIKSYALPSSLIARFIDDALHGNSKQ